MENHGKSWKIMENPMAMENHGKSWKIMENHGNIAHKLDDVPIKTSILESGKNPAMLDETGGYTHNHPDIFT